MNKTVKKGLILAGVLGGTMANAAVDVSGVALDTAPVETIAVTMLAALGIIWVARKVVNFLR